MKTSAAQFELLVTFMEQHGDLSKPCSNSRGRISSIRSWEQLTALLNSDGSGDTKTTEKWKKVWSDFKNNTKKKAARLHRAASGTGGGPATFSKLTDLEQRVLNLIGVQVATGLAVEEAGLSEVNIMQSIALPPQPSTSTPSYQLQIADCFEPQNEPGPSTLAHFPPELMGSTSSPTPALTEEVVESSQPRNRQSQLRQTRSPTCPFVDIEVEDAVLFSQPWSQTHVTQPLPAQLGQTSPTLIRAQQQPARADQSSPAVIHAQPQPALAGQTTPRRGRPRGSPRRRIRPTHTEDAAQRFLHADEQWRQFRIEQHRDYMEMRREQCRIRNMEIEILKVWQTMGLRTLLKNILIKRRHNIL